MTHLEAATALDPAADVLAGVVDATLKPRARSVLSGDWLGHPVHPLLVTVPIGAWVSASLLDATGADPAAARRLVGTGLIGALASAVTGASDWRKLAGPARRVGLVHAVSNWVAIGLYTLSWRQRADNRQRAGALTAVVGAVVLSAGGYLGGHLSYALGANVDRRAALPGSGRAPSEDASADGAGTAV